MRTINETTNNYKVHNLIAGTDIDLQKQKEEGVCFLLV